MPGLPKLHALIVGISAYPFLPAADDFTRTGALGLRQLQSPALSAFSVYRWLLANQANLPLPLGSCRLLLCPSQLELQNDPGLAAAQAAGGFSAATLNNFLVAADLWRKDAGQDPGNITWFYFAGHGVQRTKNDAVLLLEDFGQPGGGGWLRNAVDLNTLFNGMAPAPSQLDIAKTQFYFIDACRIPPEEFKQVETQATTQAFTVELGGQDDRQAPIFFATISGGAAAGYSGRNSVFSTVLLQCLEGSAGEPTEAPGGPNDWNVTSYSASKAMSLLFEDYNEQGVDQKFSMSGLTQGNPQLRKLPARPPVDVYIDIDPEHARQVASIQVSDAATMGPMALPPLGPPYQVRWAAGAYRFQVQVPQPPFVSPPPYVQQLLPPRCQVIGRVIP